MGGSSLGFVTMVCGFENGRNDAGIAGTATEMTAEHLDHFSFGRIGIALKEIRERHENAGSAESTLQRMVVLEGLLQHAELAISAGQRLHRRHCPALGLDCEDQARPHRRPIEEHRAAPAHAMLASDMGSGRAEYVRRKSLSSMRGSASPDILRPLSVRRSLARSPLFTRRIAWPP